MRRTVLTPLLYVLTLAALATLGHADSPFAATDASEALAPPAWYETPAFVVALFAGLLAVVVAVLVVTGRS